MLEQNMESIKAFPAVFEKAIKELDVMKQNMKKASIADSRGGNVDRILELLDGNSVTLDEFGTFSVSAATDKAVTNPEEIRSASIYVKNVNFIPSPRLMKRMETARFERKTK